MGLGQEKQRADSTCFAHVFALVAVAEDDAALVKNIGQSFRFSAFEVPCAIFSPICHLW